MILADLAAHLQATLLGDSSKSVSRLETLEAGTSATLGFVLESKYHQAAQISRAGAFVVHKEIAGLNNQLIVSHPRQALRETISYFLSQHRDETALPQANVHSTSEVHSSAQLGDGVTIGQYCTIHAGVVVGDQVTIDDYTVIYPNSVLYNRVRIGKRCVIYAGAIIGSDGFGYSQEHGALHKIPHIGTVVLEDDVEVGANTCIDRGCLGATTLKKGAKLDNLVHIAHNSTVGMHCALAAQVGLTGHSKLGDYVLVGGQVGIDSVTLGSYAKVAGRAGVTKSVPEKGVVSGFPAWNHVDELKKEHWVRNQYKKSKERRNHATS